MILSKIKVLIKHFRKLPLRQKLIFVLTALIITVIITGTIANRSQKTYQNRAAETQPEAKTPPQPEYAPGEVIVKLKQPLTGLKSKQGRSLVTELDKEQINIDQVDQTSLPPVLQSLTKQYKIKTIEKVFKGAQDPQTEMTKFKTKFAKEIAKGERKIDEKELLNNDFSRVYKLMFGGKIPIDQIIQQLSLAINSDIEFVEPNYYYSIQTNPNDPYFLDPNPPIQERNIAINNGGWNPRKEDNSPLDYQWNLKKIGFPQAWDYSKDNDQVVVAVIDTGVDYNHPDLKGKIWENAGEIGLDSQGNDKKNNGIDDDNNGYIDDWHGWDAVDYWWDCDGWYCYQHETADNDPMDESWENYFSFYWVGGRDKPKGGGHGTHVAGIIGANTNNSVGISGISNNAKIMALRGLDAAGGGYNSQLAQLINYATANGARIINMSWGSGSGSQLLSDVLDRAYDSGVTLIAAAGNDGKNKVSFPASHNKVIAVSATNENDFITTYSNYGSKISVAAPGGDAWTRKNQRSILSLRGNQTDIYCPSVTSCWTGQINNTEMIVGSDLNYYRASGTSMASPHVAGLASLILGKNPLLTNDQVKTIIEYSADDIGPTGKDDKFGYGRINAFLALKEYSLNLPPVTIITDPYDQEHLYYGTFNIKGTVSSLNYKSHRIEYAPYDNPSNWSSTGISLTVAGSSGITNDILGSWNSESLEGKYYLKVTTVDKENRERSAQIIVELVNQSLKSGWPKINGNLIGKPPIASDIDNDGKKEIIVSELNKIYVYKPNGNLMNGWPVTLNSSLCGEYYCYYRDTNIVVGDVDPNYPGKEIIVNEIVGDYYNHHPKIKIIHADGSFITIDKYLAATGNLADVNGDGTDEILAIESTTENTTSRKWLLRAFNVQGIEASGFPVTFHEGYEYVINSASVRVADLDNDKKEDVIIKLSGSNADQNNYLVAVSGSSAQVIWKKTLHKGFEYKENAPISIGDINNDKLNEIIYYDVYQNNQTSSNAFNLYIWKGNGDNYLSSNPLDLSSLGAGNLILADIDSNYVPDIVILSTNKYALVSSTGTISLKDYPADLIFKPGGGQMVIGDLNNNQLKEFFFANQVYMLPSGEWPQISNLFLNLTEYNQNFLQQPNWPKSLIADIWAVGSSWNYQNPIIADFDNDGESEMLIQYYLGRKNNTYIYMLKTGGKIGSLDWPQYLHDERHTGSYDSKINSTPIPIITLTPTPAFPRCGGTTDPGKFSVCGYVFFDKNANAKKDQQETEGFPKIGLKLQNGNTVTSAFPSSFTDWNNWQQYAGKLMTGAGWYEFTNLEAGNYQVTQTSTPSASGNNTAGYTQTTGKTQSVSLLGQDKIGLNFGWKANPTPTLTPTPTPSYTRCINRYTCARVAGVGKDQCRTNADCFPKTKP